jgi:mRNA interferase RelE/StbE
MRNSGVAWTIEWLTSAQRDMKKIDRADRARIRTYLEKRVATLDDPRQTGKALTGSLSQFWRFRIGVYRIICQLHDEKLVVLVVRVGHRKEIYR